MQVSGCKNYELCPWRELSKPNAGSQRIGDVVAIEVEGGDHVVLVGPQQDLLQEENEDNQLTINILNDEEGWTIVRRKKKKKKQAKTDKSDGWNKQQRINFERYGDIWYEPPYKNYRTCDEGPIAFLPLQQQVQQQQPAQQLQALPAPQVQPPPAPPLPLPPQALPGVAPLPPAPQPPHRPPQIRKRVRAPPDLPPIREEEDDDRHDQKLQKLDPPGRGQRMQIVFIHHQHAKNRRPWIPLHVVSGPC